MGIKCSAMYFFTSLRKNSVLHIVSKYLHRSVRGWTLGIFYGLKKKKTVVHGMHNCQKRSVRRGFLAALYVGKPQVLRIVLSNSLRYSQLCTLV